MNPELARKIVPLTRIAFGTASQVAPGLVIKSALLRPEDNADGSLLIRLFGSRAFLLGAIQGGLVGEEGARKALRAGAVMDAWDIGSMYLAYRDGRMGKGALAFNAAFGVVFVALGVLASQD